MSIHKAENMLIFPLDGAKRHRAGRIRASISSTNAQEIAENPP